MGEDSLHRRAQSTMDYMILTIVVLVVVIPLLFISTGKLAVVGEAQLSEAAQTLRSAIIQVNNLGYGAQTRVILRIPAGVSESHAKDDIVYFILNGQKITIRFPALVLGNLPTNEGLHHVNLFNDGKHVIFFQCGNNIREVTEQCDGTDAKNCESGPNLGCVGPSERKGACQCLCNPLSNNPGCPGKCIPFDLSDLKKGGYCAPCTDDNQCGAGKICKFGVCISDPCGKCGPNDICVGDTCVKKCAPVGSLCPDNKVCDVDGRCKPCNGLKCPVGHVCDKTINRCKPEPKCPLCDKTSTCVNEKCVPKSCTKMEDCLGFGYCDLSTNQCKSCSSSADCGGYVCKDSSCERCSPKITCPVTFTCQPNGKCLDNSIVRKIPGPICGNKIKEPGEECEDPAHCPVRKCYKAKCTVCTCSYTLSDECAKTSDCPDKPGFNKACTDCKCAYTKSSCQVPPDECAKPEDCEPKQGKTASCSNCKCAYSNLKKDPD